MSALEELLKRAKELPPMGKEDRDMQRLSFAYGNLACSTNHKPNRAAFATFAREELGWSEEQFTEWAKDKEWW